MQVRVSRFTAALVPLAGGLITLMSALNSRLSVAAGTVVATLVIHVAGLAVVSLLLLVRREPRRPGPVSVVYHLGGVIGVGTVFSTIYAFTVLGPALAVALALLGQALCSVVIDATGFLGRPRYPLTLRRAPGLALAVIGVGIMAGGWPRDVLPVLAALVGGALPAVTFSLNSQLGQRRGLLRSTRVNYLTGLGTTLVVALLVRPPLAPAVQAVLAAGPLLALGGGTLGVVVVSSMSFLFPRLPALTATLLLFCGQALTGVLLDAVSTGTFDTRKLAGAVVVLAGLAANGVLAAAAISPAPAGAPPRPPAPGRSPGA
jgi:bacterial/archaeal transporter family-2 protein